MTIIIYAHYRRFTIYYFIKKPFSASKVQQNVENLHISNTCFNNKKKNTKLF